MLVYTWFSVYILLMWAKLNESKIRDSDSQTRRKTLFPRECSATEGGCTKYNPKTIYYCEVCGKARPDLASVRF